MTLNEALIRQTFLSKLVLKNNGNELPKDLKVKVMGMRIELNKLRNQFETDSQEAIKGLKPEGFDDLYVKQDRTEEETAQLDDWAKKLTDEHNTFIIEKGKELVTFDKKFTAEEYNDLIDVNSDDVEVNGTSITGEEFLEIIYSLFVD
jgi:homoserine dehydrogenase